jgi:hypothetical protein
METINKNGVILVSRIVNSAWSISL